MKAKLLDFNIEEFLKKEKQNYLENIKIFKRQKIIEQLILVIQALIIYGTIFSVAYFPYFKKNFISSIGIILIGVSLILLLRKIILNNICFSEYPKEKYEFQFVQAIFENKEIKSTEIVYDAILLSRSLRVKYNDNGFNQEYSDIKIDIQKCYDVNELWYDLSCNKLYVPYNQYDLIKNKLCIEIDTKFTQNHKLKTTKE